MEPERNGPGAREGAEVLARRARAEPNVAVLLVDENFNFRRRDDPPLGIAALDGHEVGAVRQTIKKSHSGRGGEIRRKKPEVKIWFSVHCFGERGSQRLSIRAGPKKAVMEQRHGWMEFREDPLILATGDGVDRFRPELQIGRRIRVFIEILVFEFSPNEMAISDGELVF